MTQTCKHCDINKPLDSFSVNKRNTSTGRAATCRACQYERRRELGVKNHIKITRTHKVCTKCQIDKPIDMYSRASKMKDSHLSECKDCVKIYMKEYQTKIKHTPLTEKRCVKCKLVKLAVEFANTHSIRSGLTSRCKLCISEDKKIGWHKNKHKYRAKMTAYQKQWRKQNPERARERYRRHARLRREKNYLKVLAQERIWAAGYRKRNREQYRMRQRIHRHKRKAHLKHNGGTFTQEDLRLQYYNQGGLCYYCGKVIVFPEFHVDHKTPLCKGGTNGPENICCACQPCNDNKNRKNDTEYFAYRLKYEMPCNKKTLEARPSRC